MEETKGEKIYTGRYIELQLAEGDILYAVYVC